MPFFRYSVYVTASFYLMLAITSPAYADEAIDDVLPAQQQSAQDSPDSTDFEDPFTGFDDPFASFDNETSADSESSNVSNNQQFQDPFEPFNRKVYQFNDIIDQTFIRPTAIVYKKITPKPVKSSTENFVTNLAAPWSAINHLLQGNPKLAGVTLGGFVVNTVTSLGLANPAGVNLDITTPSEDFGQTLGVWGVESGPFVMLPFLGPSTVRDTGGRVIDSTVSPRKSIISDTGANLGLVALDVINKRADFLDMDGLLQGDRYQLLRDVYLQRRQFDVNSAKLAKAQANTQLTPAHTFEDESFGME